MKIVETNIPEDIGALARAHGQAAIQVLVDIMNDADIPASTRLSATKTILERGWGKPAAQPKAVPRAAPITHMERVIVDHRRPEKPPQAQDASDDPVPRRYGQSARAPVQATHDRQPSDDRLAQPP